MPYSFRHLKVGDRVTRLMGGRVSMEMEVVELTEDLIICAAVNKGGLFMGGWKFDRNNGAEEDEDMEWGTKFGKTGSQLHILK